MEKSDGGPIGPAIPPRRPGRSDRPKHILIQKGIEDLDWEDRVLGEAKSDSELPGEMVKAFRRGFAPDSYDVYTRADSIAVESKIIIAVSIPSEDGQSKIERAEG
jgi:hypothetical protein